MASGIDAIIENTEIAFTQKLEVTSTIRSAASQAKAMYPHFETNSTTLQKYAPHKKMWLNEIQEAYKTGKANNENKETIVRRMSNVIAAQIKQNKLISNHLTNSARDIRTKNFTAAEIKELLSLLKENSEIIIIDETKTKEPHIHIHLK